MPQVKDGNGPMMRMAKLAMRLGIVALLAGGPAGAQDLFAPAITVNGTVITRYEVQQRRDFLQALHQPGDIATQAVNDLISDRLQEDAAKKLDVTVSEDDIRNGMAEFAARGNLSTDQFLKLLGENGVQPETFRAFVRSGMLWRAALRAQFGGRIKVTEAEVDRAIATGAASGGAERVLLAEIVLPDDGKSDVAALARRIRDKVHSAQDFAQMAKVFSKGGSAANGGALNWVDVTGLPPDVASAVAGLKPGEMTQPLPQQGSVALYFLREVSQAAGPAKGAPQVDYAIFTPPSGMDLARVKARLTGCDELNPLARGLGETTLQRQTVAEASVPAALRATLAGLDAGESAIVTGSGGVAQLVMLCTRMPGSSVPPSRDDVREGIVNQKLALLADSWMEELRSDAFIVRE